MPVVFVYLTKPDWVAAWTDGGKVPINLASSYLAPVRSGTQTPDENLIHRSSVDLRSLKPYGIDIHAVGNFTMVNCFNEFGPMPAVRNAAIYTEDGLILSFCMKKSVAIARKLGKVACVEIADILSLKNSIDLQLGVTGTAGPCEYTRDHQRNHFLKSVADSWQWEYRLFWRGTRPATVTLPAGVGRQVNL